jgi:hypothetical protein
MVGFLLELLVVVGVATVLCVGERIPPKEMTMPDLNIESYYWCSTNEDWSTKVGNYTVTWDRFSHKNRDVQMDYACTCPAYKFGKGKHCKHIIAAKSQHCRWNHEAACGSSQPAPKGRKCPKCGAALSVIRVGV